ncbi:HAD-IIIC family phosphatase [Streptomyces sp. DSM 42041]|uniref:HAD-IIIC family phosphatase n=1 Tax=Streptomyces hazeniae TaxID=3075538 RepID=A0ABU2NPB6_9ACTN|nr:HAD-IIIC family phosphatase [Streptomyces sp. DSM 42041]MDT0378441.1 HAD-IIIC family phosphatase [Streptomyces sp. DSM 42041]
MTGAPAVAEDAARGGRDVLTALRALKKSGLERAPEEVPRLLGALDDVLDRESAGVLLSGRTAREALAASGAFTPVAVGVLSGSTTDSVPPLLTTALLREGVQPDVGTVPGFNQWRYEVLSGAPVLRELAPAVTGCLLDDSAVFERVRDPLDVAEVEQRCAEFPAELADWLAACERHLRTLVVLNTVPLPARRRDRWIDYAGKARAEAAWQRMNAAISELAAARPGVVVLSTENLTERAGSCAAPHRMRHLTGQAFSQEFLAAWADELSRVVLARLGRARKCLVLDLDDTLWAGIVGDDGVAGLRLGGPHPGSAHTELQSLAADLRRQGVLLTVCSKNDDAVAREAVATHPEMVLRPDDFAAFHAGWNPKPDNVERIAADLNIGIDSMVFVDDNPVERGLMRRRLPPVAVAELPVDPAGYAAAVAGAGWFNQLTLTAEDRSRGDLYRSRAQRAELRESAVSVEDYLRELDSEVLVEEYGDLNGPRIAQLFGRTNQFNLTGARYAAGDLARMTADGSAAFFGVRVTDAFGDNGMVGALALARQPDGGWLIDNFVLSCRVFSRSIEQTVVGLVLRAAKAAGAPAVHGRFVPSAKNARCAGFYPGLGFAGRDGAFRHDLTHLADLPDWLRVGSGEGTFHAP